ncbi:MAG: sulfatase-like hydrolase/transferase [Ignavibacteria bacterium]|nr:sulfatase-like hydrolase/transferase [Ignavibacteria bacterium]
MKTKILLLFFFLSSLIVGQNVIIVVIDGARYSETFGSDGKYIPHMYNDLAPLGTVFTNFRISDEGITSTNPGQASILTGTWQVIENDGSEHPNKPTIFEYFRKEFTAKATDCFIVAGKKKLDALAYSTFYGYGINYGASTNCFDGDDNNVYDSLVTILDKYHPRIMLVNFPATDIKGHSGVWDDYVKALTNADNLTYQLWQKIQNDPYYKNTTTLFITNDHGRHSDGFKDHGCDCDGCQHIMLLAIGKNIPQGQKNFEIHHQIDIAGTIGRLLGFKTPFVEGIELLNYKDSNSTTR